jgi:hypothetical protein
MASDGAYKSRSCSSSTASVTSRLASSSMVREAMRTEILHPSPIPPMPPMSASVAAGMPAELVAVPMLIGMVLDIPDISMANAIAVEQGSDSVVCRLVAQISGLGVAEQSLKS